MLDRLRGTANWQFFTGLSRAGRLLASAWWGLILLRGVLPAAFAVAIGQFVGAVRHNDGLTTGLITIGVLFVGSQITAPLQGQIGGSLGAQLSASLDDQLLRATTEPTGLAHLESPDLIDDLTAARDFDLGLSGPPLSLAMVFIAGGLTELVTGLASVALLAFYTWWAPLLVGTSWAATHWLLRPATAWDRLTGESLDAQRQAEYAYRLAMDTPAAKEIRIFGLSEWVVQRFAASRRKLVEVRWRATRLSRRRVAVTVLLLVAANTLCFWQLARDASSGAIGLAAAVTFAQAVFGASALAFGGLSWALPHGAHAVANVNRLVPKMYEVGTLPPGEGSAAGRPAREIRFRDVSFAYAQNARPVLDGFDLTVPAGRSMAIVGVNGAGKTTLTKLLCRLYDPTGGAIEVDGVDLRSLDVASWRGRVAAVFQDYIRYDLSLRENVAPLGSVPDDQIRDALAAAGADRIAGLDTVLASGYAGGVDLSGGQWQRVALARVVSAVRAGAGVVILDEPTAQLDVRGEAEIFEKLLAATRGCTTILISHRFSTVRHADLICVIEHGKVVELGTHDSLMAAQGRYQTMFDVQAARFGEEEPDERVFA